jgi:hypothetical protein
MARTASIPQSRRTLPRRPALAHSLLDRFQAGVTAPPLWSWPFSPSIPLVGKQFQPGRGLLIYASAENLSWMNRSEVPKRFTTDVSWNRYRAHYDAVGCSATSFFPDVGIAPISDGGLLTAGRFIAETLALPSANNPRDFLERIAVSNWCKFSIRSAGANLDYISEPKKLACSLPFVVGELAVLQPAVVMVPAAVWRHPLLSAAMRGAAPWARFLPVPQFNATVVNCHMGKFGESARQLREQMLGTAISEWMDRVRGFRAENAWRYLAALNSYLVIDIGTAI